MIGQAGQITGGLAVALAEIENALETQADAAAGHGVAIMPGGHPGPEPDGPPRLVPGRGGLAKPLDDRSHPRARAAGFSERLKARAQRGE